MALYALVGPGNVIRCEADSSTIDLGAGTRAGHSWKPVVAVTVGTPGPNAIASAPVDTFPNGQVTRTTTWTPMTQAQIDALDLAAVTSETDGALGEALLMVFNALFWIVNDVRSRHSQAPITLAQFKTSVQAQNSIDPAAFRQWVLELTR